MELLTAERSFALLLLMRLMSIISAPIHMAKPDQEIYEYFFRKFDLNPSKCFFIDDLEKNIQGAKDAGMDGIIFTGDIQAVKDAIDF